MDWNRTFAAYPSDERLHTIFELQAEQSPDAIAIVFEAGHITYGEANRRANGLGKALQSLGARPESCVGVLLERSADMALAVLAILKTGATYVPIDPTYPTERINFILEDAGVEVLLTEEPFGGSEYPLVSVRAAWERLSPEPVGNLSVTVDPDNLGYVIYTSGSTGKPKGVALPQRALVNLIAWHRETLARQNRVLQFASLSFDASFHEMFAAWATGGTVLLIPEFVRTDVRALVRLLQEEQAEKAILPVVVLQQAALDPRSPKVLTHLREVITTGEQLHVTPAIVDLFREAPAARLHNHYGPSETHVVTAFRLPAEPDTWASHPSIGTPIANTETYILDSRLEPAPIDVVGELYLGGAGLARGYVNHPDLTAEKFVPNPFAKIAGDRLYRTGDLARFDQQGNIVFLGRKDGQVKIHGFRVELEEIETVLARHPAVRQAVVLRREDAPGDVRLTAYLVGEEEGFPDVGALRGFLRSSLPDYMVPSAFVRLDRMPVNTNGKVDRRALPAPGGGRPDLREIFTPPRTAAEDVVADIWAQRLGIEKIGVADDFFELGGHSLVAMQIVGRLCDVFQVELPMRAIFERRTVAGLVEEIAAILGGRNLAEEIALTWKSVASLSAEEAGRLAEIGSVVQVTRASDLRLPE
jgi:amino acid adenylation domain-containing protein